MKLFKIEDYTPVPSEEAYAIHEFAELLTLNYNKQQGDKQGRKRNRGIKELRFIFFYCDYRSEFAKYPEAERREEALAAAGLPENHSISTQLKDAIAQYRRLQESRPVKLLNSARSVVDKLTLYFNTVQLTKTDEDGNVTINEDVQAKDILANVSNLGKILKGLDELETQVKKQEAEGETYRGEAEPGRLR